jgi:hypothetical protein
MKTVVATAAVLLGAAGLASAQDGRKMDELQREFERAMKGLQQKFDEERGRMEKEFRAAREKLLRPQDDERRPDFEKKPRPDFERKPQSTDELLRRILERLDHLEKRFDQDLPRFDFKKLPDLPKLEKEFEGFREFAPRWREFMPKFKDEQFRFEFKKKGDKDDDDDKSEKSEKKEKKLKKELEKKFEKKEEEEKKDEKKKF